MCFQKTRIYLRHVQDYKKIFPPFYLQSRRIKIIEESNRNKIYLIESHFLKKIYVV